MSAPLTRLPLLIAGFVVLPAVAAMSRGHLFAPALAAMFASHLAILFGLLWPNARLLARPARRFRPDGRELWLTLDDGPDPENTLPLAEALAGRGVPATFFLVGERLAGQGDLAARLEGLGHETANHTKSHPQGSFWRLLPSRLEKEITGGTRALVESGARPPRYFRSPVGMANLALAPALQRHCLVPVGWSVRALDGIRCEPDVVVPRIVRGAFPGAILLMHEGKRDVRGQPTSTRAILETVDRLLSEGYQFVLPGIERLE